MIHSRMAQPRIFPWNSIRSPEQIDRLQDITGDLSTNREKQYEIGRETVLDWRKKANTFTGTLKQFEYGSMAFWYSLAGKATPGSGESKKIVLDDISNTFFDVSAYLTDDDDVFTGSVWFPKLRVSGFSLNIGDPESILERSFNLVGENSITIPDKYFAYQTATATGAGDKDIVLSPAPVAYASGKYILRVLMVRSSVVSELLEDDTAATDDTWKYVHGTTTITIKNAHNGDVFKVYYISATAYATLWTNNNSDSTFLVAENCEIYLKYGVSTRIYRLQTVGVDASFERTDYKEIGNNEVVQTGVKNKTVKISLNKFTNDFSLEELLASDTTYPYINPNDYADTIQMMVKVYAEKEHTNFKIGYLINNITPTTTNIAQAVQDYNKGTYALEADNITISTDESDIAFA